MNCFCGQLVPIATHAIAYNLVFMTALEFISAQAPLKMKGLLVTFWYALSSQRYLLQAVILLYIDKEKVLLIFYGAKAALILLSVMLYCCVAKHYRYRLRDEVVNERYLVEEVYDRELRLAEEYERECEETLPLFSNSEEDNTPLWHYCYHVTTCHYSQKLFCDLSKFSKTR